MEDLKEHKNKNCVVVKSNKLIEAKYKLSLNEQRLIHTLISKIKSDDEEFKAYYIKVAELKDLFHIEDTTYYSKIKKITENLLGKTLSIQEKDGLLQINWISSAKYIDKRGMVRLKFDPDLKPYLLQLKSYFTAYGLDNILKLKSTYAIRLYEILLNNQKMVVLNIQKPHQN